MNFSLVACLAVAVVVGNAATVGSDASSEAYIKNYIDENQNELYETILMNFIGEHRRQLSRKQLEVALNKIDQLEPYYITLRIYRSLCSIYKQGESITHLDDAEFQLILDEARDFPQILTDLEQNWGEHAQIAEEVCIANGATRHEDSDSKTVVIVDGDEDDINGTNDPVTELTTTEDYVTDYPDSLGTDEAVVVITDDNEINDEDDEVIEDHTSGMGENEDDDKEDDEFIIVDNSGSGSGSSGSGSGSGSGGSGSGDEPITDSSNMLGLSLMVIFISYLL